MNDAITSEMMFGIPTDFPRIVDSVADLRIIVFLLNS